MQKQNSSFESTKSQKRAREIMGKNFFGVEEAIKHFGVNPTRQHWLRRWWSQVKYRQQLAALAEIPFSETVLEELKDTHILIAVFPLSILEIRDKVDHRLFDDITTIWWQSFAKEHGEASWQLVRKIPVKNSFSKEWQEQQALLGKDDEVPSARVMVYTIIGHYLATGEWLFNRVYVRTSSLALRTRDFYGEYIAAFCYYERVNVGYFGDGIEIDDFNSDGRSRRLAISSARKLAWIMPAAISSARKFRTLKT